MLSLEECRQILGDDAPADDRQLEEERADAYRLARLILELYQAETGNKLPKLSPKRPKI
jgi:hypothetical protein